MIVVFYLSIILALNFNPKAWSKGEFGFYSFQVFKAVGMFAYIIGITYFGLVDITFSAWLSHVAWILAILWIIDFITNLNNVDFSTLYKLIISCVSILFFGYMLLIYPMTIGKDKYNVVHGQTKETTLPQTDEERIVSVPPKYAKYKADKLVGDLNNYSYYDLGVYSIQRVGNKLMYITPVEFSGFSTWQKSGGVSPGYIEVDALNENTPAKLVKADMKYVPSAYFGNNLIRMVRKSYPNLILMEASFEPDDKGKPYYVVTYGHYQNWRSVPKVEGVILFDPATGDMKNYPMGSIPKFVDQAIPGDEIASPYNEWFGKYKDGWLNSWWGKTNVKIPTEWNDSSEVAPVYNNKGEMNWFTDFTTTNENASSMVGYSLMDARTGQFTFYTGPDANGLINGDAALKVVNKTFTMNNWTGTQPMLYNIYGQMTWFIPIVDSDGLLRSYALVNAKDPKTLATGTTKQSAFESYKTLVVTKLNGGNVVPGKGIELKQVQGTVISKQAVTQGNDVNIYLQVDTDKNKVYEISMSQNPFAITLKEGQMIKVGYVDTTETIVQLQNLTIIK